MVEPLDLAAPRGLEQRLRPDHVRAEEAAGIDHGQRVVRLGGEVDDHPDLLVPQCSLGQVGVRDVALDEDDPVVEVGEALAGCPRT